MSRLTWLALLCALAECSVAQEIIETERGNGTFDRKSPTSGLIKAFPEMRFADVALSFDGTKLLTCETLEKGSIAYWDARTAKLLGKYNRPASKIAFTRDGTHAVFIDTWRTRVIVYFDLEKLEEKKLLELDIKPGPMALAAAPQGRFAAVGSFAGEVVLWDIDAGKAYQCNALVGEQITSLAFSAANNRLIVGTKHSLHELDAKTGNVVRQFNTYESEVKQASVSPNCTLLAATLGKGTAKDPIATVYDMQTGEAIHQLHDSGPFRGRLRLRFDSIVFKPDGKSLLLHAPIEGAIFEWTHATKDLRLVRRIGHSSSSPPLLSSSGDLVVTRVGGIRVWALPETKE